MIMYQTENVATAVFDVAGKTEGLQFEIEGEKDFVEVKIKEVPVSPRQKKSCLNISRLKKLRIVLDSFLVGKEDLQIFVRGDKVYPCRCDSDNDSFTSVGSLPEEESYQEERIIKEDSDDPGRSRTTQTDLVLGASDLSDYTALSTDSSEWWETSDSQLAEQSDMRQLCSRSLETQLRLTLLQGGRCWGQRLVNYPLQAILDSSIKGLYMTLGKQPSKPTSQPCSRTLNRTDANKEAMRRSILAKLQRELSTVPLHELCDSFTPGLQLQNQLHNQDLSPLQNKTQTVYSPLLTDPSQWL